MFFFFRSKLVIFFPRYNLAFPGLRITLNWHPVFHIDTFASLLKMPSFILNLLKCGPSIIIVSPNLLHVVKIQHINAVIRPSCNCINRSSGKACLPRFFPIIRIFFKAF